MRIGFDAKRAFLNTSGLGNYSRNVLNALRRYYGENEYVLFTPELKVAMLEQQDDFEIVALSRKTSSWKKAWWRTFQLHKEVAWRGVQVFHGLTNELPHGIEKSGAKTVVTIHDLIYIRYPQFYKAVDRAIYFQKAQHACRVADRVIAISSQTRDDIVDFIGIDPAKIEIIHQAISPVFFQEADTSRVKERYGLPEHFLLAVGTIEERKNQLAILKAMVQRKIDLPLVLVGNATSYCNDLHHFVEENKLEKQIIFLRNIPEADLAAVYRMASVSVYISVFEGFGLPVIESMASACPVITSDVSCLPETAGGAAVLCSPTDVEKLGECIDRLLNDSAFRNEMVQKGLKRAEEFQPQKHVDRLLSLYSELIS